MSSVCIRLGFFMKCTHIWAAQTTYLFFTKLYIEPDFPSLADEIAEPRPDMDIKVTTFTVSEKSIPLNQFIPLLSVFPTKLLYLTNPALLVTRHNALVPCNQVA